MKTSILTVLALLGLTIASVAKADDNSAPIPATEWVYQGAAVADMLTTLDIAKHPRCHEMNPVLGPHPSDAMVVGYFAAAGALHYLITRELVQENIPAPIVQTWEGLGIGLELDMVGHNYNIGLHARF
jgi:hypothetical protein